jgi:general stress protein 26
MNENPKEHLKELLESFDTAMLITRCGELEHARPMAVAKVETHGDVTTIWFVTSRDAPKSDEIRNDSRVSATFQSGSRYVALSGTAELAADPAKIKELWKPTWKVWFPEGKDDPKLELIKVNVTDAEFWDNAGTKGIRYVFEAAKALMRHKTPEPMAGLHGRVKQSGETPAPEATRAPATSAPPVGATAKPATEPQQPVSQRH